MGRNASKNIAIGTQQGEGQVSQCTVVPISASSFTHAAEAATNFETDIIPLSMTGATGAPAPNGSAVSQIQVSELTCKHLETNTLSDLFGHVPVGPPMSLPPRNWTLEQLKEKIEDVLGLDCSGKVKISYSDKNDGKFYLETCLVDDGQCTKLWSVETYMLDFSCNPLKLDNNMLGDVLANYEYNGICGVDMYLYHQCPERFTTDEEPEGSESLPANSPEHVIITSSLENGNCDE